MASVLLAPKYAHAYARPAPGKCKGARAYLYKVSSRPGGRLSILFYIVLYYYGHFLKKRFHGRFNKSFSSLPYSATHFAFPNSQGGSGGRFKLGQVVPAVKGKSMGGAKSGSDARFPFWDSFDICWHVTSS